MIWAATGTRHGGTPYQIASVGWLWSRYGIKELHDGDSIGVDEQLYYLGHAFGAHITLHPPTNEKYRAFCGLLDCVLIDPEHTTILPEKGYHARDRDMVDEAEVIVSVQWKPVELDYGGTRYTTDYAREQGKPLALIWPNGHISYENWNLVKL